MRSLDLRPGFRRRLLVAAVREHAVVAPPRQPVRGGEADSAGAARDYGDGGSLRGAVHCGTACVAGARQWRDEGSQAARGPQARKQHESAARARHLLVGKLEVSSFLARPFS